MIRILSIPLIVACVSAYGQTPSSPYISDYGVVYDIEGTTRPDPGTTYRILVDLKSPIVQPNQINSGLNNVARMVNLHGTGGIPKENLKIAVAIHGGATSIVLDNLGYNRKHGTDNPNLDLIEKLSEQGVEIFVCGQSLVARGYDFQKVYPEVEIGLSMLTIATEKMMAGYGMFVFD